MSMLYIIFFMLITAKKTSSNYVVNNSVMYLIISTDLWLITNSSFHVNAEVVNKKVGKICWVFQGTILINSHRFALLLLIIEFFLSWSE